MQLNATAIVKHAECAGSLKPLKETYTSINIEDLMYNKRIYRKYSDKMAMVYGNTILKQKEETKMENIRYPEEIKQEATERTLHRREIVISPYEVFMLSRMTAKDIKDKLTDEKLAKLLKDVKEVK